jgi:hypothetical protein
MQAGRPTDYTEELGLEICALIAEGKSLVSICKQDDKPSTVTVYAWLNKNPEFLNTYTRAKEDQADTLTDQMLDLADSVIADTSEIAKARLQIETRKWTASKLKPKKYGDKLDVDANVKSSVTIVATPLDEQI